MFGLCCHLGFRESKVFEFLRTSEVVDANVVGNWDIGGKHEEKNSDPDPLVGCNSSHICDEWIGNPRADAKVGVVRLVVRLVFLGGQHDSPSLESSDPSRNIGQWHVAHAMTQLSKVGHHELPPNETKVRWVHLVTHSNDKKIAKQYANDNVQISTSLQI